MQDPIRPRVRDIHLPVESPTPSAPSRTPGPKPRPISAEAHNARVTRNADAPRTQSPPFIGRITSWAPRPDGVRAEGTFTRVSGATIRWVAPTGLITSHAGLFCPVRSVVYGGILSSGDLRIDGIRHVKPGEWADAVADLIATRYSTPADTLEGEQERRAKIAALLRDLTGDPVGRTPSPAWSTLGKKKRQKAELKRSLMARDGAQCAMCPHQFQDMSEVKLVDLSLAPVSSGGQPVRSGFVLACEPCQRAHAMRARAVAA